MLRTLQWLADRKVVSLAAVVATVLLAQIRILTYWTSVGMFKYTGADLHDALDGLTVSGVSI